MDFFEVKIKYDKVMDNGAEKAVTETYAMDAMSFTEAEAMITEYMTPIITGEFVVKAIKRAQYHELVKAGEEKFFLVKYNIITIDEKSGNEKKTLIQVLFQADTIDEAKDAARKEMGKSLVDYELVCVKETPIIEMLTH